MQPILVVDDRNSNRVYLADLLSAKGYGVLQASDGLEALRLVRSERPSLVLADLLMPRMDGYEFAQALRRDPDLSQTPIIFISGQFTPEEATTLAEQCGVYELIFKPAEPDVILGAVERALGGAKASGGARASRPPAAATGAPSQPDRGFEDRHRRLLTDTLAKKAGELEVRNRQLSALVSLCQRLATERDARHLVQSFCSAAGEIVSARCVVVALYDIAGDKLRHVAASGDDDAVVGSVTTPSCVASLLRLATDDRRSSDHAMIYTDEGSLAPALRPLTPVVVAPVATASRVYGALCLGKISGAGGRNGADAELVATLAAQLAIAYENTARYAEIQRHAEELQNEISERKRAQEETRRLNQELERRVAERTQALEESQQQLRLSERMASMGTLCAGLGHDMGNLLLPIKTRLDAIRRQNSASEVAPHLSAIDQCVEYLQTLTNGLRMLALDGERQEEAPETDLDSWCEEIKPLLKSMLPRGIKLECNLQSDLPLIRIGKHRLSQAVFNIVSNSVDALRDRECGTITFEAERIADDNTIQLRITDDGPGMSEEVRSRMLDPYFTTKRRAFSTGLGMSLVHSVVEGVGGSIDIESAPGRGTRISLVLPVAAESGTSPAAIVESKPVAAVSFRDERLKALAAALLQSMGYDTRFGGPPQLGVPNRDLFAIGCLLADATIWLTDADADNLDAAREFLNGRPQRRVGVSGPIDEQWQRIGAIHLGDSNRPSQVRLRLREIALPDGLKVST